VLIVGSGTSNDDPSSRQTSTSGAEVPMQPLRVMSIRDPGLDKVHALSNEATPICAKTADVGLSTTGGPM
jgi:hypothetical protein